MLRIGRNDFVTEAVITRRTIGRRTSLRSRGKNDTISPIPSRRTTASQCCSYAFHVSMRKRLSGSVHNRRLIQIVFRDRLSSPNPYNNWQLRGDLVPDVAYCDIQQSSAGHTIFHVLFSDAAYALHCRQETRLLQRNRGTDCPFFIGD